MPVLFYSVRESPYGCFSNFSPHPFELDGKQWPTSEHYFQARKFVGTPSEEEIRRACGPMKAAELGRERDRPLRKDWDAVKDDVMRRAVRRKFEAHDDIRAVLLSTGDEEIVENAPRDYYWGCGADGSGKNMLGKILMEVRAELRHGVGSNTAPPSWEELLRGIDCPLCGSQPDVDSYKFKITTLTISTLYLFRDQRFRGYCFLIFDPYHATDLDSLADEEYRAFMDDLRRAGEAIRASLRPDHLNYESLGNSGPHLHWHIIPRYKDDPRWGQPVWEGWPRDEFNINRVVLSDADYAELIGRIRARLIT